MSDESLETRLQAVLKRLEKVEADVVRKDQIIAGLQQRLFGSKSERLDPNQVELGFEDVTMGKPEAPSLEESGANPEQEEEVAAPKKSRRRRKGDLFPENLLVVIDQVIIPEEVAADLGSYEEIGEEHHDELDVTRARLFWRRVVRKKYRHVGDRSQPPVMAPAPLPSVPGTLGAPDLISQILVDKYVDHLPHYRQSARFSRRHEVELSRQTLNKWTHAAAEYLAPIGEAILAEVLSTSVLQVDETPIGYLEPGAGKTAQGYLWPVLDPQTGNVHYSWRVGRGHEHLVDILGLDKAEGGFSGVIQCDGYSAYDALAKRYSGIRLGGCLAHIRRKFYEAQKQAPEVVLPLLRLMQELYRIEESLRQSGAPPSCRELVRRSRSGPVVEEIYQKILIERARHLPQSNLGKALSYALNQWESFKRYVEEGCLEIDNNLVENAIRPTKLGAKNYLFFGSAEAGHNSALIYTLMANCKVHSLDPEKYLAEVICRLPASRTTLADAMKLTPAAFAKERELNAVTKEVVAEAAA